MREKNWSLGKLCEIYLGPQFQNITIQFFFFTWCRASENLDCYPKMGKFVFYKFVMSSLGLFEAKRDEKLKQNLVFPLTRSKSNIIQNFNF